MTLMSQTDTHSTLTFESQTDTHISRSQDSHVAQWYFIHQPYTHKDIDI